MPVLVALYACALVLDGAANLSRPALMVAVVEGALGYPSYFLTIVGVAKISAGLTFALPMPRQLKQAAVLGLLFEHLGALASHLLAPVVAPGGPVPILMALGLWAFVCWRASRSPRAPDGWFAVGVEPRAKRGAASEAEEAPAP